MGLLLLLGTLLLLGALRLLVGTCPHIGAKLGCSGRRSPPGPFAWPLVGNALELGRLPHVALGQLAQRYGSVFQLRLGQRRVLVLSAEPVIRRALVGLGSRFAGRPDFPSCQLVIGEQLSKLQLFLFTAILLHQCSFHANPAEQLSMACSYGLVLRPQLFTVTVRQRQAAGSQP